MDDFLHNLRSGKLKQPDRGRRDYTGPQRRVGNERRKPDYYAKVTSENFALVKDSLDTLAGSQKRIGDELAAGKKTAARIADALEAIAVMMGRHWGYETVLSPGSRPEGGPEGDDMDSPVATDDADNGIGKGHAEPSVEDEIRPIDLILAMRAEGESWEKIARYLDDQNIPTVSGKGKWRGPAVKKFWATSPEGTGS